MKELSLKKMEEVKGGSCASGIIGMWMVGGIQYGAMFGWGGALVAVGAGCILGMIERREIESLNPQLNQY
ncbi:MAG: hypothetical protein GDA51_13280 [Ekhidna sp.]|nr:hypothetical protein [Ekhidna sp.]MBC6427405.1 hypothetical protein [Ekhidna sp.]